MRMSRTPRALRAFPPLAFLACTLLAACSPPEPPDEARRPEPQARPKSTLVETANAYKDTARASVAESEAAAKRQQAELDAATQ